METSTRNSKAVLFFTVNYNSNPTLKGKHVSPYESIPCIDEIHNEWTDKDGKDQSGIRKIRYAPGEHSIFADEQSAGAASIRAELALVNGYIGVDPRESTKLEYLKHCNFNGDNENRLPGKPVLFKMMKPSMDAKKKIEIDQEKTSVKQKVYSMGATALIAYAKVLKVNTDREFVEIQHDMIVRAETDPKKFLAGMEDPTMIKKYNIIEAIERQILSLSKANNNISWQNGAVILQGRIGEDVVDNMAVYCLSDESGKNIYSTIMTMMSNGVVSAPAATPTPPPVNAPVNSANIIGPDAIDDLIKTLVEKQIVTTKKVWLYLDGQGFMGKKNLKKHIEEKNRYDELMKRAG